MAGSTATNGWVGFVFTCMTGHLREGAAGAEKGTAQIFAAVAVLFRDGVLLSNTLAGAAKTVKGPDSKQDAADRFQDNDQSRSVARPVLQGCHLQRRRVNNVGCQQKHHYLESVLGSHLLTGFPQPSQGHAGHDLGHGDLATEKGAAPRSVAKSRLEAIKETILPFSSGGIDAIVSYHIWKESPKSLSFFDSSFGLPKRERR